jgi:hypothetical protein
MTSRLHTSAHGPMRQALGLAGLFLALALGLEFLWPEALDRDVARRLLGVAMGAVILVLANKVPKTLTPLARLCDPALEQSMRRVMGWSVALGGLGYALAWIFAPIELAAGTAMVLLASSLLYVFVWHARLRSRRAR